MAELPVPSGTVAGRNEFVVKDEGDRIVLRRGASSLPLVAVLLAMSGTALVLAIRSTAESGRTMGIAIAGLFSLLLLPQVPLEMSVRGRPPRQLAEFERVLADAAQRFRR